LFNFKGEPPIGTLSGITYELIDDGAGNWKEPKSGSRKIVYFTVATGKKLTEETF